LVPAKEFDLLEEQNRSICIPTEAAVNGTGRGPFRATMGSEGAVGKRFT
jgi:hypothetical protein